MNSLQRYAGLWLLLMFCAPVADVFAQKGQIMEQVTGTQLQQILRDEGYAFELDADGDIIWKIDGVRTMLLRADKGKHLMFRVAFKNEGATMERINDWNRTKRYSRSYLDTDGDPVLELDLDFVGGVTRARVVDFLLTCKSSLSAWSKEVL